jgi:hypothetical protein
MYTPSKDLIEHMEKATDGLSTASPASELVSTGTRAASWEYSNPWNGVFGTIRSGASSCVTEGMIPESGTRTELLACILAVYDPMPQVGEKYCVHGQFTDIETAVTFFQDIFLETMFIDQASQIIGFKKDTEYTKSVIVRYSFNSWHNLRAGGNFKYIGNVT